ncbi:MAG TPA: helix-turn-helix domain-containing protein [Streptosporangiaceae bacterium]
MVALQELLVAPALRERITVVSGVASGQPVESLTILENIAEIRAAPAHTVALLTEAAVAQLEPYRLDMALRVGATRPVSAIAFVGAHQPAISRTGRELSERRGPVLLAAATSTLTDLVPPISREIDGGAGSALQRLSDLVRALQAKGPEQATVQNLVSAANSLTQQPIVVDSPAADSVTVLVVVDGRPELSLSSPRKADPSYDRQTEIALQLLADAVARALAAQGRAEHLPITSRSELLTAFLSVDQEQAEPILRRARAVGVPMDGWHVLVALEIENLLTLAEHDEVAAYELREEVMRGVHGALRSVSSEWHRARSGLVSLFVQTSRHDPGWLAARAVARCLEPALASQLSRRPGLHLRCAVGSVHSGPHGLRASALEALAGLSEARLRNIANQPVVFDAASVRRGLIEWYASDSARESARRMLAPLETLTAEGRQKHLRTIMAYLDAGGSMAKAAKTLYLHRNAVAYRMKHALALLDVDINDPEQRLMLHLACRAELLRSTGAARLTSD